MVSTNVFAKTTYEIEKAINDETFIINGEVFKAQTYCFNVNESDKVIFTEGSALGACASAEFVDLRTGNICKVWCE
jgi:hypothetical protein